MFHPSPERRSPEQMMRPTALRILVEAASRGSRADGRTTRTRRGRHPNHPRAGDRAAVRRASLPGLSGRCRGTATTTSSKATLAMIGDGSPVRTFSGLSHAGTTRRHQSGARGQRARRRDRDFYAAVPTAASATTWTRRASRAARATSWPSPPSGRRPRNGRGFVQSARSNFVELEAAPSGPAAKTGFVVRQQDKRRRLRRPGVLPP